MCICINHLGAGKLNQSEDVGIGYVGLYRNKAVIEQ